MDEGLDALETVQSDKMGGECGIWSFWHFASYVKDT